MFYRLSKQFGKPVCVALYGAFAYLAAKKKPEPEPEPEEDEEYDYDDDDDEFL